MQRSLLVTLAVASAVLHSFGCQQGTGQAGKSYDNTRSEQTPSASEEPATPPEPPRIQVQCRMKYWCSGKGECSFMNIGQAPAAVCGRVDVVRHGVGIVGSGQICSGIVAAKSLRLVEFQTEGSVCRRCSDGLFDSEEDHCSVRFSEV
ncbi:MAG: hypothetical protein FJ109_20530, partial [Deltaproteobacteria bacterium]|nr:hypothetical protein [Deltaproteobacteria bacterium]